MKYNVLILGASYGSLFSTKLLMAGHSASLVCTKGTADLINREGTVVRFPIKGREGLLDISSKGLPGALSASTPEDVDPGKFDLIVLGMQEAQYGSSGVRELMARVGKSRKAASAFASRRSRAASWACAYARERTSQRRSVQRTSWAPTVAVNATSTANPSATNSSGCPSGPGRQTGCSAWVPFHTACNSARR